MGYTVWADEGDGDSPVQLKNDDGTPVTFETLDEADRFVDTGKGAKDKWDYKWLVSWATVRGE